MCCIDFKFFASAKSNKHPDFKEEINFNFFYCRIEEELGDAARFAGKNFRNPLNK